LMLLHQCWKKHILNGNEDSPHLMLEDFSALSQKINIFNLNINCFWSSYEIWRKAISDLSYKKKGCAHRQENIKVYIEIKEMTNGSNFSALWRVFKVLLVSSLVASMWPRPANLWIAVIAVYHSYSVFCFNY
jgi:hypothetical protein